jgi:HNH endonuclease/Helix-turn-helix domain of resolvase
MRLDFCVACGNDNPEHLHHHHLVARVNGGTDDETNLITLCRECHGKAHGVKWSNNLGMLIKLGQARALASGVRFGRPPKLTPHQRQEALTRLAAGETQADIARSFNVHETTIGRL